MQVIKPAVRLIRGREVDQRFGFRSPHTRRGLVRRGLLTSPIRLSQGPTTPAVWPDNEINAVVHARIAGKTEAEIRELVTRLEAARGGE